MEYENIKKSSKFLLETVKLEFDRENNRNNIIENRVMILVTISTFMLGYYFSNFSLLFKDILGENKKYNIIPTIGIICLILAILIFVYLLVSINYRVIELKGFSKEVVQDEDENRLAYEIIKAYLEAYEYNQKINNKKNYWNNLGIILLLISFISLLIMVWGGV